MRSLAIVLLVLATASSARAGAPKLTAITCTLDGDPLVFADNADEHGALVVAPDGDVIVLDGANRVRRYRVKPGKGCALTLDRTVDLGVAADRSFVELAVDADGTIYVSDVPKHPLRVKGGEVDTMCGDDTRVNASPLSKIVWRYQWATKAIRERGDCSGATGDYLQDWDVGVSHLWAVDDRAVAYGEVEGGGHKLLLYGGDGAELAPLAMPTRSWWLPLRFTRCGKQICALASGGAITWWDDRGAIAGSVDALSLVAGDHRTFAIDAIDLGSGAGAIYLLTQRRDDAGDRTIGVVYRLDGFVK